MPLFLLMLFSIAFATGACIVLFVLRRPRQALRCRPQISIPEPASFHMPFISHRPVSWLAVKGRSIQKVQDALHLHNPRPCPLFEGLAGDMSLFIAPPLHGWILILGSGLPDPADDVDACFKFLSSLSRKLGEVQFFSANPVVQHHAWVRLVRGRVERAFAWAGETIWVQGKPTPAERIIGAVCPGYAETPERTGPAGQDFPAMNVEKVALLAARWSLDPGSLEFNAFQTRSGITGEWTCGV